MFQDDLRTIPFCAPSILLLLQYLASLVCIWQRRLAFKFARHTPLSQHLFIAPTRWPRRTMLSFAAFRLPALVLLTLLSLTEFVVAVVVIPYELRTYGGYNASAAELAVAGGFTFIMVPLV